MKKESAALKVLKKYMDEDLPEFSGIDLVDVNQYGNFGNTPLHVACIRGISGEVKALLAGGADPNAVGELGNTPLHEAVGQEHIEIVKILLNMDIFPLRENEFRETALDLATGKGLVDVAGLISRSIVKK